MLAKYLQQEEGIIRKKVLLMGHESCIAIEKAVSCYKQLDIALADEVINNDRVINDLEKDVESACIHVIATQQPVAHDLRELLADMNISKELERIADYAVSIAKIVQKMPPSKQNIEPKILEMAEKAIIMLTEVMIDYAEEDAQKASEIARKDDELDDLEHQLNDKMFKNMQQQPEHAIYCTYQLWIIHQLERIGDRVTNIAESVVFQATGKVVNFD